MAHNSKQMVEAKQEAKSLKTAQSFKRMHALGQEKVAMIDGYFAQGKSANWIADTIQQAWGDFKDVKRGTVIQMLNRYRNEALTPVTLAVQNIITPEERKEMIARVESNIDVMVEYNSMFVAQKRRVEKLLEREADMPLLFNSLRDEIKLLAGLAQNIGELQQMLGLLKTKVKQSSVSVTMPGGTTVQVDQFESIVGQAQSMLDEIFDTNGKDVIDVSPVRN